MEIAHKLGRARLEKFGGPPSQKCHCSPFRKSFSPQSPQRKAAKLAKKTPIHGLLALSRVVGRVYTAFRLWLLARLFLRRPGSRSADLSLIHCSALQIVGLGA